MFIIGSEKSLRLQTRRGTDIDNFQSSEISNTNRNFFQSIESKWKSALRRTNPSGIYNCHGMVFANKRCFIDDPSQVLIILEEDDYIEVNNLDVLPGDVVVYFKDGDVEHSGIVVEEPKGPLFIPLIVSKWATHAEFIHRANYGPYDCTNIKYFRIYE